jgi:hypothetical protein
MEWIHAETGGVLPVVLDGDVFPVQVPCFLIHEFLFSVREICTMGVI